MVEKENVNSCDKVDEEWSQGFPEKMIVNNHQQLSSVY